MSDLTILIPTKNRLTYLIRVLAYYADTNFQLLVLDGSDLNNYEYIKKFLNVTYIHDKIGIDERISKYSHMIKTKYIIMHGDYEFAIKRNLILNCEILDKNINVSAVTSRYLSTFSIKKNGPVINYKKVPRIRIKKIFISGDLIYDDYELSKLYSVSRTKNWNIFWKNYDSKFYHIYAFSEYKFELFTHFTGNIFYVEFFVHHLIF